MESFYKHIHDVIYSWVSPWGETYIKELFKTLTSYTYVYYCGEHKGYNISLGSHLIVYIVQYPPFGLTVTIMYSWTNKNLAFLYYILGLFTHNSQMAQSIK